MEIRNFIISYTVGGKEGWKPMQTAAADIASDSDIPGAVLSAVGAGARIGTVLEVIGDYTMQDLQAIGAARSLNEIQRKYGNIKTRVFLPPFWQRKGKLYH